MLTILAILSAAAGGAGLACWRLKGDRTLIQTMRALGGGGPDPKAPK